MLAPQTVHVFVSAIKLALTRDEPGEHAPLPEPGQVHLTQGCVQNNGELHDEHVAPLPHDPRTERVLLHVVVHVRFLARQPPPESSKPRPSRRSVPGDRAPRREPMARELPVQTSNPPGGRHRADNANPRVSRPHRPRRARSPVRRASARNGQVLLACRLSRCRWLRLRVPRQASGIASAQKSSVFPPMTVSRWMRLVSCPALKGAGS